MAARTAWQESAGMTFPTVTEITPRMEPVTPDPFIAGEWQRRADSRGPSDVVARLQADRAVAA
jgi:hypothetical protein